MKPPIKECCPTLKFDNVDRNQWRSYDANDYFDYTPRRFLDEYHNAIDKHRHILRYFHDSIDDRQLKIVVQYFKHYRISFDCNIFGDEDGHMEVLKDLYFEDNDGRVSKHKAFIGFDKNNWYNDNRITGIRQMSRNGLTVKRTIFAVDKTIYNWRTNKTMFDNK